MKDFFQKIKSFFKWSMQPKRKILFEIIYGLTIVYGLYFIGTSYYNHNLNSGKNIYTNTVKTKINSSRYVNQLQYYFKVSDSVHTRLYPVDINLNDFDYSKTYTVRYLKEDPSYSELILVEWEEYKKQLDPDEYIEYLDE